MSARFMELLRDLKAGLFDFAFPGSCRVCNRSLSSPERFACETCLITIPALEAPFCLNCRAILNSAGKHCGCKTFLKGTYSLWTYSEEVESLIHHFKYKGKTLLGQKLSSLLAENLRQLDVFPGLDLLIPVPLFPSRRRERGFNQAEIISRVIADSHGLRVENKVLKRDRNTRNQTQLSALERKENVRNAFSPGSSGALVNKSVLLVDDVTTTGATLCECARVLQEAGVKEVYACTLAVAV